MIVCNMLRAQHFRLVGAAVAALVAYSSLCRAVDPRQALVENVSVIDAPGVPGHLCVFGERAVVIVAGGAGGALRQPVAAATTLGRGRVVALGHNGYFSRDSLAVADTGRFMLNAVRWTAGEHKQRPRVAVRGQQAFADFLRSSGIDAVVLPADNWSLNLGGFDVLCVDAGAMSIDRDLPAVAQFVGNGGGLVTGQPGWGWLQLHPGKSLASDHPGTRLLAPAGIAFSDGMAQRTHRAGFSTEQPPPLCHASRALEAVAGQSSGATTRPAREQLAQASATLMLAMRSLPSDDTVLLPRIRQLRNSTRQTALPAPGAPLKAENFVERLVLAMDLHEIATLPPDKVRAHPAASRFPGSVPAEASRVSRTLEVDTRIPNWHSTGLYAPAGEVITVSIPADAVGARLAVRIGPHTDRLWHLDSWSRCPEISCRSVLSSPTTPVASAFGGLIYIDVPADCRAGSVRVSVAGALEAPLYVAGSTSLSEWRSVIRARPAPWGELAGSNVILTVPSEHLRNLDDPESLMKFWDSVLDVCAELAAMPARRPRPERYVADAQISAGYMHSGYPIMTHLDAAAVMVDLQGLRAVRRDGVWGLFHEMGHNHQSPDWTFAGTTEVTVNLFTRYIIHRLCTPARPVKPYPASRVAEYLAAPDFEKWKADPFLALAMYDQMVAGFGWETFKKVFAEYRALPPQQRPKTDDEKRDQWLVRFSRAAGRDLSAFFRAWGVPVSQRACESLRDLPSWLPEEAPFRRTGAAEAAQRAAHGR